MSEYAKDFVPLPDLSMMVGHRRHDSYEPPTAPVALVLANFYGEHASYRYALIK
jgi:hypothetical protein